MISEVLESIPGVGTFPVISLLLFFAVFVGVLVWVVRAKKPYLDKMENLPLESAHPSNINGDQNNG